MSHETDKFRFILPRLSRGNYNTLMKLISPSLGDPAVFRKHVLTHYYKYGWRAARDAFGVKKSTLYDWKRLYEFSGKREKSLVPISTRPHNTRAMTLDTRLVEFIKSMRQEYDHIGRAKVKYFLDEYARELGVDSYGTTKIGLIVKRRGFNFAKLKQTHKRNPLTTTRVKRSPKENVPGYIEMDTVHLWVLGKKHYFVTLMDVATKFAWVVKIKGSTSRQSVLALREYIKQYSNRVRVIQTDNGSEFLGEFDAYLRSLGIKHEFIYPRSPKINGYIERFNRTFKEEFLYKYELDLQQKDFNKKLTRYLIWYNTRRPHQALKMIPPVEYLKQLV